VMSYDFYPAGKSEPSIHKDVVYEREQYPEDIGEKDIELHAAPATRAHMKDFMAAIASRGRPVADIEEGHISTASCILANLAMQLGRPLAWDAAKGQLANDAEANRLLKRAYRSPWIHPAASA
jgi:Oxidoreductase family, C-terminal alpha/beta domain